MSVVMSSKSLSASGEASTRKAMLLPKSFFHFIEWNAFTEVELLDTPTYRGSCFGILQAFEKTPVTLRILNCKLGMTIDSKHERRLAVFKPTNVFLDVALEFTN